LDAQYGLGFRRTSGLVVHHLLFPPSGGETKSGAFFVAAVDDDSFDCYCRTKHFIALPRWLSSVGLQQLARLGVVASHIGGDGTMLLLVAMVMMMMTTTISPCRSSGSVAAALLFLVEKRHHCHVDGAVVFRVVAGH
jgi:hypothetical protein